MLRLGVVDVVNEGSAWVQDGPNMVHHLTVGLHHVKIESVRVLALEVTEKRLTESGGFDYAAYTLPSEECVEFCDCAIESLGGCSALEFKVHLFWSRGAVV